MDKPADSTGTKALWRKLLPFVGILIFGVALWALNRQLTNFKFSDLRAYFVSLSALDLGLAIGATLLGYLALVGYDWFAIKYVGQKLAFVKVALVSFIGFAFSLNIGQTAISGGAVRMRLYTGCGFGASEITKIIGFNLLIGAIGQFVVAGLLFTFYNFEIPESIPGPIRSVRWLGVLFLIAAVWFFWLVFRKKRSIQTRKGNIEIPAPKQAVPGVIISSLDWIIAALVLYKLMPHDIGVDALHFIGIVLLAQILGALSQIPGGLGVFETTVIHLLPESAPEKEVISALIAFRAIYYLTPFLLAIVLLGGYELKNRSKGATEATKRLSAQVSPFIPVLVSTICFVAGAILLISGATPAIAGRIDYLRQWIPLPIVELAHFLGSIVGILLILLSDALRRRVDFAYFGTMVLLLLGIGASLLKGLDYEEAAILGVIAAMLYSSRKRFTRSASLFAMRFRPGWWFAIGLTIATTIWIGFVAYEKTQYDAAIWTQFGFRGDAARFLRSAVGIAMVSGVFGIWQLLRPGLRTPPGVASGDDLVKVREIVARSGNAGSSLALLGDKRFLFSESGRSFLMFGIRNRTWVVMGDPVGEADELEDLIWAFRDLCNEAGARPAFYQVSAEEAHHYAGCGLMLFKLGEEALVDLKKFSLEGAARRNLRGTKNRMERDGARFEMLSAELFDEHRDKLRSISDDWLREKSAAEKGFSLGSFDEDYLRNFDFAIIRVNSEIVAFANVSRGADQHELSIDLMRHTAAAPPSVMEYLFIELMLWGKGEGYHWFSLGMAPLSGLENRAMAPLWNRLGSQIFLLGEHFYNFKGLRAYKEKFDPQWEPRYLACRGKLQLPGILIDISALIGGGLTKVIGVKSRKSGK
ncbi:MAG: bifunctional lysylphosphatidylglycerol flippase/synthetase MprF [Verrucomicrobiales bacterium]|nr:bifunctional lysylphosphatidylglycerol flippase/synthetase MprF [Verrucomicrobiales bacterium]